MKRLIVLIFILLFAGCVTTQQMAKLEQKVADLEEQVLMGGTERAGASFYPFTGGLIGDTTGTLDHVTGVVNGDVGMVALKADATYGNSVFFYILNEAGVAGDVLPLSVLAGDAEEDWELTKVYGSEIIGRTPWGAEITGDITIGDELTEVWGKVYLVSAACTITLEKASTVGYGATVGFYVRDTTETVIIEEDDADIINLHGTPVSAGDQIESPGNVGDFIFLIATTDADGGGTDGWLTLGYGLAAWIDGGP